MQKPDEIEIKFTEILNIFYRKKRFFLGSLAIGIVASIIVVLFATPTSYHLKLTYKIDPTEEVDVNQLVNLILNRDRAKSLAERLNLKLEHFYTNQSDQAGQHFAINKEFFKNQKELNVKLYDSLTLEFYIKEVEIPMNIFSKELESQVLKPSFTEFRRKQALQNFLINAEKKINYLLESINNINQSTTVDRETLEGLKNRTPSDSVANVPSTIITQNIYRNTYDDHRRFELTTDSDFLGRHLLSLKSQKLILENIIFDKEAKKKGHIVLYENTKKAMDLVQEILENSTYEALNNDQYNRLFSKLSPELAGELDLLFKDKVLNYRKNYYLINPYSHFKSNHDSKIKTCLIIIFSTLIIAVIMTFLSDYWDQNKSIITRSK